jgi:hypothetical protein
VSHVLAMSDDRAGVYIGLAGLVAAILALPLISTVRGMRRRWRLVRGTPERLYGRWFFDTYSTYKNPYLGKDEKIDLNRTYIPLSFHGSTPDSDTRKFSPVSSERNG